MTRFHVIVSREDIDFGVRANCRECPVARALKRTTGLYCEVYHNIIEVWHHSDNDRTKKYYTPTNLQLFIQEFDYLIGVDRSSIKPVDFTITIPDEFIRDVECPF